jgi:hypothetical protein
MRIDMEFAPFTCVFVIDSTLQRDFELTTEHLAAARRKAKASTERNFSVTHFDMNLEATSFLSIRDEYEPAV